MDVSLYSLLDHLAAMGPNDSQVWEQWTIHPLLGGANNRLYRTTCGDDDLVVKFTIRDGRDRAGREFAALQTLQAAGLAIAPVPVLLDRDRYPQPVVVQRYLAGEASAVPPTTEEGWHALVTHYAAIHSVQIGSVPVEVAPAVLTMSDGATGMGHIYDQFARVPPASRPPTLAPTIARLERLALPRWLPPPMALCRIDANISNFLRRPGMWASVDWENSGWGDPVFELADLWTHPAYAAVPSALRDWAIDVYCAIVPDQTAPLRVRCYVLLMSVWWMARTARLLYEVPLGRDQRLVVRSSDWAAKAHRQYDAYHHMATNALDQWNSIK
jgi:aminoglycoside phosphotransferase (APT) family kinase protein